MPTRAEIRELPCPSCEADVGEPCRGRDGSRDSHHSDRIAAWQAQARAKALEQEQRHQRRPYDTPTRPLPPQAPPEERARVHAQLAEWRDAKGWPHPKTLFDEPARPVADTGPL